MNIFLTGELRFKDVESFQSFKDIIAPYNIYISTYSKYSNIAKELTDDYLILSDTHKELDNKFYQWKHLDLLIKKFGSLIPEKDIILKLRMDCDFSKKIFDEDYSNEYFLMQSDLVFGARKNLFVNVLKDFYTKFTEDYFSKRSCTECFSLDYKNLILSKNEKFPKNNAYRWEWFCYPKKITNNISTRIINYDKLIEEIKKFIKNSEQINIDEMDCSRVPNFIKRSGFISCERMFLYHILKSSPVRNFSQTKISLKKDRHLFNYGINKSQ